jgi:hypothetical protein
LVTLLLCRDVGASDGLANAAECACAQYRQSRLTVSCDACCRLLVITNDVLTTWVPNSGNDGDLNDRTGMVKLERGIWPKTREFGTGRSTFRSRSVSPWRSPCSLRSHLFSKCTRACGHWRVSRDIKEYPQTTVRWPRAWICSRWWRGRLWHRSGLANSPSGRQHCIRSFREHQESAR